MTAILRVREVGQREFVQHNGEFEDEPGCEVRADPPFKTGEELAIALGERLTVEGNVEAFQVWTLHTAKQRVWKLEEME